MEHVTIFQFLLVALAVFTNACPTSSSADLSAEQDWNSYKLRHNKVFQTRVEEQKRREIWKENMEFVKEHNERFKHNLTTYTVEMNQFSDRTAEELVRTHTGARVPDIPLKSLNNTSEQILSSFDKNLKIPNSLDWRQHGIVTGVKDQQHCGSCWAFSSVGAIESFHARTQRQLVSLSEENLVECAGGDCVNGGDPMAGFRFAIEHGIDTEDSYPYTSGEKHIGQCRFNPNNVGASIQQYGRVQKDDESALAYAIATFGPVSVSIDAHHNSFHLYRGGVYYEPACSSTDTNHAVLAVGYGPDHYIIKNSWGTGWGTGGYMYLARNRNNHCGVASYAGVPTK